VKTPFGKSPPLAAWTSPPTLFSKLRNFSFEAYEFFRKLVRNATPTYVASKEDLKEIEQMLDKFDQKKK
jgi:hypothetical protein